MTVSQFVILIVIGLISGFLAGVLGVGGAIVVIPALVFILGLSQHEAQGTSLAFMLPPVGVLATWNYYKEGYVNWKFALVLVRKYRFIFPIKYCVKCLVCCFYLQPLK